MFKKELNLGTYLILYVQDTGEEKSGEEKAYF